ncbi:MAG: hypothetical protein KKD44_25430 [Proteobacteria bacterium]|nr:hypothetical protein [Pseudomonadota bacterium]
MSKREKILVVASVVAFIWGGMMVMDNMGKKQNKMLTPKEDVTQFILKINDAIAEDPSKGLGAFTLSRARGPWGKSPFLASNTLNFGPNDDLRYHGYVRSGNLIYALINNREYSPGEDIDGRGLRVKTISPDRVVIVENGKKKRILPLEGGL